MDNKSKLNWKKDAASLLPIATRRKGSAYPDHPNFLKVPNSKLNSHELDYSYKQTNALRCVTEKNSITPKNSIEIGHRATNSSKFKVYFNDLNKSVHDKESIMKDNHNLQEQLMRDNIEIEAQLRDYFVINENYCRYQPNIDNPVKFGKVQDTNSIYDHDFNDILARSRQERASSLRDNELRVLALTDEERKLSEELKKVATQRRSLATRDDRNVLRRFEEKLAGRKWRSASLIAAQSVLEEECPLLKNNGYEEVAIDSKINVINECQLLSSDKKPSSLRKIGICERNKRDRMLVATTLHYYQSISNWFFWMISGEKE